MAAEAGGLAGVDEGPLDGKILGRKLRERGRGPEGGYNRWRDPSLRLGLKMELKRGKDFKADEQLCRLKREEMKKISE